jgi:SAM-dependent methyltransferase
MRFIPYLRYFCYICWHWDPLLALFTIYYELRGERKYGIHTMGEDELASLKIDGTDISHASIYMPVNYYILEQLMQETVRYGGNKTFLDIGCGKGRVMVVAAAFGFKQITGIDFSKTFCEEATLIVSQYAQRNPGAEFKVIHENASGYEIPGDISTIFLFNPFDEFMMWPVVSHIVDSQEAHPRTIRVLYANPQHKAVFTDFGFVEIYQIKKLNFFEGVILQREVKGSEAQY